MAFHVRNEATDAAVRKLAKLKKKTLTATIREAIEHEYEREFGRTLAGAHQGYPGIGSPRTGRFAGGQGVLR